MLYAIGDLLSSICDDLCSYRCLWKPCNFLSSHISHIEEALSALSTSAAPSADDQRVASWVAMDLASGSCRDGVFLGNRYVLVSSFVKGV